ncbi:MAG: GAF domain-containing protein [Anaerolineae bacterium]
MVAPQMRELAALYEVCCEISSRLDLDYVLRSVTDKARQLLDAEVAVLCLLNESGQTLKLAAASGAPAACCGTFMAAQQPPAAQILAGDQALLYGAGNCAGACGMITTSFRASHLAAPLRVGGRVIGALCVGSPTESFFSSGAAGLLTKLANAAAIALENARLYDQAERVAMLEERQRLAAAMHDGLAQTLNYLKLKSERVVELIETGLSREAVAELQHIQAGIGQASQEVRRSIASLQADPRPPQSLQDCLTELVADFARHNGPPVELMLQAPASILLPSDEAEQALYVVREALLNAYRHAQAQRITICLEQQAAQVRITVADDGQGFDPTGAPVDGGNHFGLSIMRARSARIGGQFSLRSTPGQGTHVSLTLLTDRDTRS